MFEWLVDNATIFYVLLGCVGLALAFAWWSNRSRGLLVGLVAVVALAVLLYVLTLFVVSDQQRLTNMILEMASAVPAKQPDRIVKHLSKDFEFRGYKKADAAHYVEDLITRHSLKNVYVTNFRVEKLSRSEGKAMISFLARVEVAGEIIHLVSCETDCVLEDGQWRLMTFRVLRPGTNEPIHISHQHRLRNMIHELANAVPAKQPDRILELVSKDFEFQSIKKADIGRYVSDLVPRYSLKDVNISEFDVENLPWFDGRATITVLTRLDTAGGGPHHFRCRADCVLEGDQWRVKSLLIYNHVIHHDQPIQTP